MKKYSIPDNVIEVFIDDEGDLFYIHQSLQKIDNEWKIVNTKVYPEDKTC